MRPRAVRIAALVAIGAALYCFAPPQLPLCGFRWLTGHPCPLCGLTRAMFALAKGHWREALALHALSPVAAVVVGGVVWGYNWPSRVWIAVAALFGAYGVWRMFG